MNSTANFILASASPRRAEILERLGFSFDIRAQALDESRHAGEAVSAFVLRLAKEKASAAAIGADLPALGADTLVVLDEQPLGKPANREEALDMLLRLSGRRHQVLTAVAVVQGDQCEQVLSASDVSFRKISTAEAEAYWQSGEPADKAGSYAIQGLGAVFVEHLQGSYSGVVGLPVFETVQLLAGFGIHCLTSPP